MAISLAGNNFLYYLPKSKSSKTVHSKTLGKNGLLEYRKPFSFIDSNFKTINQITLRTTGSLPRKHILTGVEIIQAALEGGYGRRDLWTSDLAMNKQEASDLARYLLSRVALATSCLLRDKNRALSIKSMYEQIEASEKGALSFILGGIGSYVAARLWLRAGGDGLNLFLHAGIYSKAVNKNPAPVKFSPTSKKNPDYLAHSNNRDWHVFESKGGAISDRWMRIVQGLAQLDSLPCIHFVGAEFPKSVKTAVCVHTSVDANEALTITVVDPPGDNTGTEEISTIELIGSVCKLLLILETVDQFRALAGTVPDVVRYGDTEWARTESNIFSEYVFGIPNRYLKSESRIRVRVGIYLAAEEAYSASMDKQEFLNIFRRKVLRILRLASNRNIVEVSRTVGFLMRRVEGFSYEENLLLNISKVLKMERIAGAVMTYDGESIVSKLRQESGVVFTSGGMYIGAKSENGSSSRGQTRQDEP
ncbi:hypothetical protein QPK32_04175 [Massilia sp. YIM B02763]|uniref:hypothetical protein n=1 Tax=Massilia sp. YIM B02763 TaxID=3050130 RepID=UPI0025B67B93|nr:hypothetical protein [Massilia sp. YIM B02763]MDN4052262.1 hypothetical protein [Massilia sp. YIM B02763]